MHAELRGRLKVLFHLKSAAGEKNGKEEWTVVHLIGVDPCNFLGNELKVNLQGGALSSCTTDFN